MYRMGSFVVQNNKDQAMKTFFWRFFKFGLIYWLFSVVLGLSALVAAGLVIWHFIAKVW